MAPDAASGGPTGRSTRLLKIAGFVLAAVVAVGLLVAAFLSSRYFTAAVEAELVGTLRDAKQRTLRFEGPLEIFFWPSAGFKVGRVTLSEPGGSQEFASVDAASFSLAVAPLLDGRIVIEQCAVDGLKAVIVKHRDGTLNIDDLIGGEQTPGPKPDVDLAGVNFRNSTLAWVDEARGATTTARNLDLSGTRLHMAAAAKTLDAGEISLAGELGGARLRLALDGLTASPAALKADRAAFDVGYKDGRTAITAALTARLAAEPEQGSFALEGLAGDVAIVHPRLLRAVKLPLKGAFHAGHGKAEGNLSAHFDESNASLGFRVTRFAPLALRFDMALDRLDIDRYLAPNHEDAAAAPQQESQGDLSALKNLELDGTAKIGSLQIAGLKTTNIRLDIRSAHGALDVRGLGGTGK